MLAVAVSAATSPVTGRVVTGPVFPPAVKQTRLWPGAPVATQTVSPADQTLSARVRTGLDDTEAGVAGDSWAFRRTSGPWPDDSPFRWVKVATHRALPVPVMPSMYVSVLPPKRRPGAPAMTRWSLSVLLMLTSTATRWPSGVAETPGGTPRTEPRSVPGSSCWLARPGCPGAGMRTRSRPPGAGTQAESRPVGRIVGARRPGSAECRARPGDSSQTPVGPLT